MKHTRCITNIQNCNANDFNKPATAERRMLRESCAKLGNQLQFTQGKKTHRMLTCTRLEAVAHPVGREENYHPSHGENIGLEILTKD